MNVTSSEEAQNIKILFDNELYLKHRLTKCANLDSIIISNLVLCVGQDSSNMLEAFLNIGMHHSAVLSHYGCSTYSVNFF